LYVPYEVGGQHGPTFLGPDVAEAADALPALFDTLRLTLARGDGRKARDEVSKRYVGPYDHVAAIFEALMQEYGVDRRQAGQWVERAWSTLYGGPATVTSIPRTRGKDVLEQVRKEIHHARTRAADPEGA
jgi:hypothetical protein